MNKTNKQQTPLTPAQPARGAIPKTPPIIRWTRHKVAALKADLLIASFTGRQTVEIDGYPVTVAYATQLTEDLDRRLPP